MVWIRRLHKLDPVRFSQSSPKCYSKRLDESKWRASENELGKRRDGRDGGARIGNQMAELCLHPRQKGIAPLSEVETLKDESELTANIF